MKRIQKLPAEVVATIAAGEVIQRPAHAIKELVENSLDAGASEITILLSEAGSNSIEVIDNGTGIAQEDLTLAVTPHATSKLSSIKDFNTLMSYGFRGEALASIGQVAELQLASRLTSQNAGFAIFNIFGKVSTAKPIGMPAGTRVTVTNLFGKTPVRKDSLKQSSTELRQIVELITSFALAYPQVGFTLKNEQRQLLKLAKDQSLIERTQALLGTELFSQLIPIQHTLTEKLTLTGFISQPSLWTKRPTKQYLFVNQRIVKHSKLQQYIHGITNQFQANTLYPLYSLYLEVEPTKIDVNIHPQKTTITFYDFNQIKELVSQAITPNLYHRPITYTSGSELHVQVSDQHGQYRTHKFRRGLLKEFHQTANQQPKLTGTIEQLANLYLLAPTTNGLLLVDQHALHERILFDQLSDTFQNNQQKLLYKTIKINLVFDLSPQEALLLEENKTQLQTLGIQIESFGQHSYKVTQIPELFGDHNIFELITDVLEQSLKDQGLQNLDTQTEKLLASMGCRLAIKAGDYISPEKRQELVAELLTESHIGTCPHGRPVAIRITLSELDRLFGR